MRLVAFCEAAADFRIASDLVDRVLRERGPEWVTDLLDVAPEGVRSWHSADLGHGFFALRDLTKVVDQLAVRVPHGHFDGRRGAADAVMGRTVFWVVRELVKRGDSIDAVVLVRDLDDQPVRRSGLDQARTEARSWADFQIAIGCADPKREAWVLCGFEPEYPDEHTLLRDLRQELGFQPHVDGHQLDAKHDHDKRSAKRVLRILTGDDGAREQRCWQHTALEALRDRGGPSGLRDYLEEIERYLLPLLRRA